MEKALHFNHFWLTDSYAWGNHLRTSIKPRRILQTT